MESKLIAFVANYGEYNHLTAGYNFYQFTFDKYDLEEFNKWCSQEVYSYDVYKCSNEKDCPHLQH